MSNLFSSENTQENLLILQNPLTYGLLAYHCANYAKSGPKVEIDSNLTESFMTMYTIDVNIRSQVDLNIKNCPNLFLKNWKVHEVVKDLKSGYFGVIYLNHKLKKIVLAHKSTDFLKSLKSQLFSGSSLKADIDGVLRNQITLYNANGCCATHRAIEFAKKRSYSVTFTGHSLGAWMAQLSVFYSIDYFKFENVNAITFDGPGALDIIQKIAGPNFDKAKIESNIVGYLSAPNFVNCANSHIGTIYRCFPILETSNKNGKLTFFEKLSAMFLKESPGSITSLYGHWLKNILPYFQLGLDRENNFIKMDKWPSIDFTNFNQAKSQSFKDILRSGISKLFGISNDLGMPQLEKIFEPFFNTTISSSITLSLELFQKKDLISAEKFWLVHKYLDKNTNFKSNATDLVDRFFLEYSAQYRETPKENINKKNITSNQIDQCILKLWKAYVQNNLNIQCEVLRSLLKKIDINTLSNEIKFLETQDETYEAFRQLLHLDKKFYSFVDNLERPRLISNNSLEISQSFLSTSNLTLITNLLTEKKFIIIKGLAKSGKTCMAQLFCQKFYLNFTTCLLNCTSEDQLHKSVLDLLKISTIQENNDNVIEDLVAHLDKTKERVIFILDNTTKIDHIKTFMESFLTLCNVKFIITTRNDMLIKEKKDHGEITTEGSFDLSSLTEDFQSLDDEHKKYLKLVSFFERIPEDNTNREVIKNLQCSSFLVQVNSDNFEVNKCKNMKSILESFQISISLSEIFEFSERLRWPNLIKKNLESIITQVSCQELEHLKNYVLTLDSKRGINFENFLQNLGCKSDFRFRISEDKILNKTEQAKVNLRNTFKRLYELNKSQNYAEYFDLLSKNDTEIIMFFKPKNEGDVTDSLLINDRLHISNTFHNLKVNLSDKNDLRNLYKLMG
ncbi:unnamed protein product, partial [Brachionus calyciflorus]